jgi:hypothetical protein
MAKSRFIQSSFVSGELSPLLKGRIDINQYYQAVETADNVVIVPQGGMRRRPGTEFIGECVKGISKMSPTYTMPNGGTTSVLNDGNDATTTSTTTGISTTNPYIVAKMDLLSAQAIEFVDLRQISLSSGTSSQFKIQYSTDDVTYTDAASVPLLGSNPQNFRLLVDQTARYWRLARIGSTDLGAATVTLAGLSLYQESAILSTPRLVDMSVEDDRHYLVEFTRDNIRIYRTPNTRVADIKPTYSGLTSAQIENIRVAQVENVMLIVGDFAPMRLINLGTDDDWLIDNIPFTNVPQYDFDDAQSPTPVNDVQVLTLGGGSLAKGDRFQVDIHPKESARDASLW